MDEKKGQGNNEAVERIKKFLIFILFAITIVGIVYFIGVYVLKYFIPFIVSFCIATMLQPLIKWISQRTKIPRKVTVLALILVVVVLLIFLSYLIIDRAITELNSLADTIGKEANKLKNDKELASQWISKINSLVPFVDATDYLETYWNNINENISKLLEENVATIGKLVPLLTDALFWLIDGFFIFVVVIVSTFYFANDYYKIREFVSIQFKGKSRHYIVLVKDEFINTVVKFVKAYGILMFITFIELFLSFTIIGIKYALLLAFVISLIDVLPILGVGTVMIPWGLFMLIKGDYLTGIALLSAYLIITVVREIVQPRIVGKYIGLYPLVTLIAMYAGLKAFGLIGLFGLPITAIILKKLNDEGHVKLWDKMPEGTFAEPNKVRKERDIQKMFKKKK